MTPAEFRAALASLSLDQGQAASLLGVSLDAVNAWANGRRPASEPAARLLRLLARYPDLAREVWLMPA